VVREIANEALSALDGEFALLYPARLGRPSIPPERLLRAMLLQAFQGNRLLTNDSVLAVHPLAIAA